MADARARAAGMSPAPVGALAFGVGELDDARSSLVYPWPHDSALDGTGWSRTGDGRWLSREMPESPAELAVDSRWPALFPSPLCLVTTSDGNEAAIEKVVGASIVNRFPYVMALSFCRDALSDRHYPRQGFMTLLERSGTCSVQFLMPGPSLVRALSAIASVPDDRMAERLERAAERYAPTSSGEAPVLGDAYLVYQGRLVRPGLDLEGQPINQQPYTDCGSHRIYFFEINRILLADEIASGHRPLHWRSLPTRRVSASATPVESAAKPPRPAVARTGFTKTYRPDYVFPNRDTVAFAGKPAGTGFSVLDLPALAEDQVEIDNDRARWPCFFPSSLGMITAIDTDGTRAAFPCGSTSIVSRSPLTVAICVSYARINARYAPRASLDVIRRAGRFGCGVPLYSPAVLDAIAHLGNVSLRDEPAKVENCGLTGVMLGETLGFAELPIHLDCKVVREVRLGTHALFLGEVQRIFVDGGFAEGDMLEWCPWAGNSPPAAPSHPA